MNASTPPRAVDRATWRVVTIRAGIVVYWLSMFLGTHLPVQEVVDRLPASDKHLHLMSYCVLGFALPWWGWRSARPKHWRSQWHPMMLWMLIVGYAAIDEWLQIPVGRTAEWGDWLADAAGAAVGVSIGTWVRAWTGRKEAA
mgnify:FL=1